MEQQQDSSRSCGSSGSKKPHSESDRYKHDIEQAMAMRRRKQSTIPSKAAHGSPTKDKAEAIALGLRGLDEADILREQGHSQCALELYQSAIEVLIRLMQGSTNLPTPYEKEAIKERVQLALSDAEHLKGLLQKGDSQQTTCEASTESPMRKTCFSRIKEYLASSLASNDNDAASTSRKETQTYVQKPNHAQRNTQTFTSKQQLVRKPLPSAKSKVPAMAPSAQRRLQHQQHHQPPTIQKVGSKESDILMKTVMDDMYVPTSKLQSTTWDDIAGLASAKQALQEAAIMPLLRPDLFTGLRKPQNILLYGSPGTGKTLLVKAVAYESKCSLFLCTASAITSKWLGEGEKMVRALFQVAQQYAPSIIFIDEIDALLSARKSEGEHEASRRFKTEFMVQMDGISSSNDASNVLLIACTNCPWDLDSAILRRFSRRIFIPLPDKEARKALLKALLKKAGKHSLKKGDISDLSKKLKGFSGSDIQAIASEASFGPLRSVGSLDAIRSVSANDVRPLSMQDFENAMKQATKSVTKEQLARYEEWKEQQAA